MNFITRFTSWYFSKKALPYWGILAIDCAILMFSGYVASYLADRSIIQFLNEFWPTTFGLLITTAFCCIGFKRFHTYSGIVRYSSFVDLERILAAMAVGTVLAMIASGIFYICHFPQNVILLPGFKRLCVIFILSTLLMWFVRIIVKVMFDTFRVGKYTRKAYIYGIREGGVALAKTIKNAEPLQYALEGFVRPDGEEIEAQWLMGVRVRNEDEDLVPSMIRHSADTLIVSPLQADHFRERNDLINELLKNNIQILMIPQAEAWDGQSNLRSDQMRKVEIEDLLPRDPIKIDMDAIGKLLTGKRILITGAAGSIGSEMVRQVAKYSPAEMILIDQAETPMHDIRLMMKNQYGSIPSETIVTSIANKEHMEKIFAEHRPEYVFHAAAYKHVPMMEDNPGMAVQNNIYGTRVIADLAVKYETKKFVMISTDKAVNPTNVMGCSKRICEIYCQSLNKAIAEGKVKGITQFVTTRFGNVLGSNGSVIPIFKKQIEAGGPITVTHPDIIRYFMLIPEACKLVLEAGTMGKGGEIFVFDMGKPVRIVDLAVRMISLSGAHNIEIKFTGLRDGEKLYEEVLSDKENTKPTIHPKIMIAQTREYDYETAVANEERLLQESYGFDDMAIVKIMKEIVPEYKSKQSKYEVLDN